MDAPVQEFYFIPAATVISWNENTLPRMQTLRDNGHLAKVPINRADAFYGDGIVKDILFISHRWEERGAPDSQGVQLRAMQEYLETHSDIKWVWYDYSCMAQKISAEEDGRTESEKAEFDAMLDAIADLYLTARVLILMDTSYDSRFWTLFEAYWAMMKPTAHGIRSAGDGERRYGITCIHNADKMYDKPKLVKKLSTKTPEEMHEILSKPDTAVTNAKDKDEQLIKLLKVSERVQEIFKKTTGRREVDLSQSAPAVLQRYSSASLPEYPSLSFTKYREQNVVHHINLEAPCLQLVNESPFIFAVSDFLSKGECEKLIALYATSEAEPSATTPDRNSKSVWPPKEEIGWLRDRIAKLANVEMSQLDRTKVTHYSKGEYFKPHIDTHFDGGGKEKMEHYLDIASQGDLAAAAAKLSAPIFSVPDRFCSVFVYLNDVPEGGQTIFSNLDCFMVINAFANACDAVTSRNTGSRAFPFYTGSRDTVPTTECTKSLSFRPRAGMAVIHFPTTTSEYSCFPDPSTSHEGEVAVDRKFIVQQFIWSVPVEQARTLSIAGAHDSVATADAVTSALGASSIEDLD